MLTLNASSDRKTVPMPLCIFAWLLLQGLAIALAAFRIPLWAHAPATGEFLAIDDLLIIQILASSLMMSRLVANWQNAIMAIAAVWPFAAFAGFLATAPTRESLLAGAYVSGWIAVLSIWRTSLKKQRAQMTATAIAACWSAGGPVLLFIRNEYSGDAPAVLSQATYSALGPLMNGLAVVDSTLPSSAYVPWISLGIAGFLGGGTLWVKALLPNKATKTERSANKSQIA